MCILLVLYTLKGNPGHLVCIVCNSDSDMRFVVNRAILRRQNHQLQLYNPKFDLYLSYFDPKISVDPPKVIAATKEVSPIYV